MVDKLLARMRSLWRGVRRRAAVEAEMNEEFRLHVELRTNDLVRSGLSRAEALLKARREFGSPERYKEEGRASRWLNRVDALRFSWLDFKLGFRMLAKYPGLTLVGGLGLAMAIAIGAGYTSFLNAMLDTTLPLPQGDRIVALQNWDLRIHGKDMRSLHDFVAWRDELRSVQDVGAYRTISRNLVAADGTAEPLSIAEMSAAGFRVAGVQPLMGRHLLDEDERPGAPPVVVIGYDVWQRRFAADPRILGRELRFGSTFHTVVGVMPESFAFPINHQLWMPFHADPTAYERGEGPSISVFGRLAPGVTLTEARAEITVIGEHAASAFPETHAQLRPRVQLYTYAFSGMDNPSDVAGASAARLLFILLLVVISVNVAALVYARTAVRRGEILVRTALGASRRRVIAQLFAEALVLAILAATVGLAVVGVALRQVRLLGETMMGGQLPFWFDLRLSFGTIVYAVALAVLAAMITGILPALKATGRRLQTGLQQLSSGGSEMLLGRTWTLLIIGQVTFTVALLPVAVYQGTEMYRYGTVHAGFAAEEYLSTFVNMERDWEAKVSASGADDASDFNGLYTNRIVELMRKLRSEPGVSNVTYAWSVPGSEPSAEIEVETSPTPNLPNDSVRPTSYGRTVRLARVDIGFFNAFDIPILAGRSFITADADTAANAVIVNQSFVRFLADGNVLGRRFRYVDEIYRNDRLGARTVISPPPRWYEIVGVVPDFPNPMIPEQVEAKVYQASTAGAIYPANLAIRLRGASASSGAARLRKVTSALDPALQLQGIRTLEEINDKNQSALRMMGLGIAIVTLSVLLLSAGGIYAITSLAVARRRREIGIRAALGANPRRILASIFTRAAVQLGVGVTVGLGMFLVVWKLAGGHAGEMLVLLAIVAAIMVTVGLLASIGPARRGLRIQPTEALRHE